MKSSTKNSGNTPVIETKKELKNCECWNSSDGFCGDLPAGLWIEIVGNYDSFRTTILASTGNPSEHDKKMHQGGIKLHDGSLGFRFIVSTKKLNEATGLKLPILPKLYRA